jgi:hypothetical protein
MATTTTSGHWRSISPLQFLLGQATEPDRVRRHPVRVNQTLGVLRTMSDKQVAVTELTVVNLDPFDTAPSKRFTRGISDLAPRLTFAHSRLATNGVPIPI